MPDFSKAKIYKLVSTKTADIYIGSCLVELSKRLSQHKAPSNTCISKSMFINDAIITIVLIENYQCENKNQLKARELHYITTLQCININKPFISDVNYGDYKEWVKLYKKQYNIVHAEHIKQYRSENVEQRKQYRLENVVHITQQTKQYQLDHAEDIKQYQKQYHKQYNLNKKLNKTNTNIILNE